MRMSFLIVLVLNAHIWHSCTVEVWVRPATATLGQTLVQQLALEEPAENVLVSPLSIQGCFSLIYPGAKSTTASEMKDVLVFPADIGNGKVHQDLFAAQWPNFDGMSDSEYGPKRPEFVIGYRVYVHGGNVTEPLALAQDYSDIVGDLVVVADLGDMATAVAINAWTNETTRGRITSIVPEPLPGGSKLVAVNTVYLKAEWRESFLATKTYTAPFESACGTNRMDAAHYMTAVRDFPYHATETHQFVFIPLSGGLTMALSLASCSAITSIAESDIINMRGSATSTRLALALPKFEFEASYLNLGATLQTMGIDAAFSPTEADFSGIVNSSRDQLYVSNVVHKTYIGVDENGVEAAAATSIIMRTTSVEMDPPSPTLMLLSRPFDFVIYEDSSETVLFQGRVEEPTVPSGAENPGRSFDIADPKAAFREFVRAESDESNLQHFTRAESDESPVWNQTNQTNQTSPVSANESNPVANVGHHFAVGRLTLPCCLGALGSLLLL